MYKEGRISSVTIFEELRTDPLAKPVAYHATVNLACYDGSTGAYTGWFDVLPKIGMYFRYKDGDDALGIVDGTARPAPPMLGKGA